MPRLRSPESSPTSGSRSTGSRTWGQGPSQTHRRDPEEYATDPITACACCSSSRPGGSHQRLRDGGPHDRGHRGQGVPERWTSLVLVVALALIFGYTNGFHDAANAIATSVSTHCPDATHRARPGAAANPSAPFGTRVAETVGGGPEPEGLCARSPEPRRCHRMELGHLVARPAVPSSHALIGGLVGAAVATGADALDPGRRARHRADAAVPLLGLVSAGP